MFSTLRHTSTGYYRSAGTVGPLVHLATRGGWVGAVIAAAGVGYLSGTFGANVLVATLAAILTVLTIVRPVLGLMIFAASIPIEDAFAFDGFTATKWLGAWVGLTWLVNRLLNRKPILSSLPWPYVVAGAAFCLLVTISSLWAKHPNATMVGARQLTLLFAMSIVVIDLCNSWKTVRVLSAIMVGSGILVAALTVQQYLSGGVVRAGEGIAGVNGTGEMLITLLPFAYFSSVTSPQRVTAALIAMLFPLTVLAVPVTFSRMNMMVLPLVLTYFLWRYIRDGGTRWILLLLLPLVVIGAPRVIPREDVVARAQSILPYLLSSVESGTADVTSASGRGYHLRVAYEQWRDHPFVGVGYDNYGHFFRDEYQYLVPGAPKLWYSVRSPHSSHAGIAADLGIVGILLWTLLLGVCFWYLRQANGLALSSDWLSRQFFAAVLVSLLLQVGLYGWYTPQQKTKIFWLLLAFTVVCQRLAGHRQVFTSPASNAPSLAKAPRTPGERRLKEA